MLNDEEQAQLADMLAVTAEVVGDQLRPTAGLVMVDDLSCYSLPVLTKALTQCRRELKGRLTLAAIIERIDDGHPAPNEAWAVAIRASDEGATVVWTREMEMAWGAARPLMAEGDKVAARMAFIEAYGRNIRDAKANRTQAKFHPSLGFDAAGRDAALRDAVARGLLSAASVEPHLLPGTAPALPAPIQKLIAGMAMIEGPQ